MKLAKQRLRQIINEELQEVYGATRPMVDPTQKAIDKVVAGDKLALAKLRVSRAMTDWDKPQHRTAEEYFGGRDVPQYEELPATEPLAPDPPRAEKEVKKESISQEDYEGAMAADEPRHEGGTPEERLLHSLLFQTFYFFASF